MKQIFLASTLFEVVGLAAGIDSGVYDHGHLPAVAGGDSDPNYPSISERILVLSDNSLVLELSQPLAERPGMSTLLRRFDRAVSLNELLDPLHPSMWSPRAEDAPLLERQIRTMWGLGTEDIELVLESPQVNPAIALARIFRDAWIRVHADGLMSYGPTRSAIPLDMGQRTTSLHYLPLASELEPRLLMEFDIRPCPLPVGAFRSVISEITAQASGEVRAELKGLAGDKTALIVGQYLAALQVMTEDEETQLHLDMLDVASREGADSVVFKPHPAAPPNTTVLLQEHAAKLHIELRVLTNPVVAEVVMEVVSPVMVIGGFSTALATARSLYGIATHAVGTKTILEHLTPYQNSNRIPATIIDAIEAQHRDSGAPELQRLVDAVSYCMQPAVAERLRPVAESVLSEANADMRTRWFRRRRLQALGLPGGPPQRVLTRSNARKWRQLVGETAELHAKPVLKGWFKQIDGITTKTKNVRQARS